MQAERRETAPSGNGGDGAVDEPAPHARLEIPASYASRPLASGAAAPADGSVTRPLWFVVVLVVAISMVFFIDAIPELFWVGLSAVGVFSLSLLVRWLWRRRARRRLADHEARTGRIIVGDDGTYVDAGGRRQFFEHHRLAVVNHADRMLSFRTGAGDLLDVVVGDEAQAAAVVRRVGEEQDRLDQRTTHRPAILDEIPPAHAADELAAWTDRLADELGDEQGYRRSSLPIDDLLDLVADPCASAEARVGIAAALARTDQARHRIPIERAARSTANEPLRIALEHAAEGRLHLRTISSASKFNLTRS